MSKYAANTDVPSDRSRSEIEKTLQRYGATAFMYGWNGNVALIQFEMGNRRIKFQLQMPDPNSREFTHTDTGRLRKSQDQVGKAYEQATRQRWRALALVIKAKLEAVESGISEFEEEFLAHIVLPNSQTVGEYSIPRIAQVYESGDMQPLLPYLN